MNYSVKDKTISLLLIFALAITLFAGMSAFGFSVASYADSTVDYGTTTEVLNVRSGPSTSYATLGSLSKGTSVTCYDKQKGSDNRYWYRISYNGKDGYICADYVALKYSLLRYSTAKTAYIKNGPANIRNGASDGSASVGTANTGSSFNATGVLTYPNGDTWYRLTYAGSSSCYIKSTNVSFEPVSGGGDTGTTTPEPTTPEPTGTLSKTVEIGGNYVTFNNPVYGSNAGVNGSVYPDIPKVASPYTLPSKCRPTTFNFTAYTNKVLVAWNNCVANGADIDGYILCRRVGSTDKWTELARTDKNTCSYYDTTATKKNTNYFYLVFGYKKLSDGSIQISPTSLSNCGQLIGSTKKNTYNSSSNGNYAPTLNKTTLSLKAGESYQLKLTYSPLVFSTWTRWRSDKSSIAKVDSTGKVTAVSPGTTLISARTPDGRDIRCTVTVTQGNTVETMSGNVKYTFLEGGIKIYSAASTSSTVIGNCNKGSNFYPTSKVTTPSGQVFYTLTYSGKTGYVLADKCMALDGSNMIFSESKYARVHQGPVDIKTSANPNATSKATVLTGSGFYATGIVTGTDGKLWYQLTYSGTTCYIPYDHANLVVTSGSTKTEDFVSSVSAKMYSESKMYSSPSTSSSVLITVPKNATITALGFYTDASSKVWVKITYSGKTGYVPFESTSISGYVVTMATYSPYKLSMVNAPTQYLSAASTSANKSGSLVKGDTPYIYAKVRNGSSIYYQTKYNGKTVYLSSAQVELSGGNVMTDSEFEAFMTSQGFPEDYKPYLRTLHAAHPDWYFTAQQTGLDWNAVCAVEEDYRGRNVISSLQPVSWRCQESDVYNSKTGTYTRFDGSWYQASDKVIEYYLDPRNFLNEESIYQFLDHHYYSSTTHSNTVETLVSKNSCFMNTSAYKTALYNAASAANVNVAVLTAMVIQEQGWKGGSGLVSGTNSTYPGIYNHFNIGAYTTSTMTAVQRGLWWASQTGSYGRPWNTIEKSLTGGSMFYKENYIDKNQYTYYTKKFNVYNGASNLGSHQYMTNVMAAESEGQLLRQAYANNDQGMVFRIPVYINMPSTPAPRP